MNGNKTTISLKNNVIHLKGGCDQCDLIPLAKIDCIGETYVQDPGKAPTYKTYFHFTIYTAGRKIVMEYVFTKEDKTEVEVKIDGHYQQLSEYLHKYYEPKIFLEKPQQFEIESE